MYWTRSILSFFQLDRRIVEAFLKEHQVEFQNLVGGRKLTRSISYTHEGVYSKGSYVDTNEDDLESHKSVCAHKLCDSWDIKENVMYPSSGSEESFAGRNENFKQFILPSKFTVKIEQWINSDAGNFIEFQMAVSLNEGGYFKGYVKPQWTIYKRYSDFVCLHDKLLPTIKL